MTIGKNEAVVDDADGGEGEEGFDAAKLVQLVGFFLHAPKRRPKIAIVVPVIVVIVSIALAAWLPRSYSADLRIVTHHNAVLSPHDNSPPPQEPTAGVTDEIMQHDNLVAMIKQLDLVARWDETRPPIMRAKDSVTRAIFGPPSDQDKAHALIGVLEQRLQVSTDQNSITLAVDWPNPQVAYDVVNAAYKNFLDARYESQVNVYAERLRILEMRAQLSAQEVDTAVAQLTKLMQDSGRLPLPPSPEPPAPQADAGAAVPSPAPRPRPLPRAPAPPPMAPAAPTAGVVAGSDLDTMRQLEDVRAQIRVLDEDRHRRMVETQAQLADAQATLGPLHPTVLALKEKAAAAEVPPPQLASLRDQERTLVAQLAAERQPTPVSSAGVGSGGSGGSGGFVRPPPNTTAQQGPGLTQQLRELLMGPDDPATAYARSKLQSSSQQYSNILSSEQLATVELDAAREAFKNTYSISRPAEKPSKPKKPNVPVILLGGLVGAILLAFLAPAARDFSTGIFLEAWQVESALKVPVLGELTSSVGAKIRESTRPPS